MQCSKYAWKKYYCQFIFIIFWGFKMLDNKNLHRFK